MTQYAHDKVIPYAGSEKGKKEQVAGMFDDIAHRYDFLNRFLSAGIDTGWRRKAIAKLKPLKPRQVLDVATGTADVAILTAQMLKPDAVTGIDISEGMLAKGREKVVEQRLEDTVALRTGDSERLDFPEKHFDAATVAFGVRNFADLEKGLSEILRVLRPGGMLVVLEFSRPGTFGLRQLYGLYTAHIAPRIGGLFARNREAYRYLHDSVQRFPEGGDFMQVLERTGFKELTCERLSLGICSIYTATRPS